MNGIQRVMDLSLIETFSAVMRTGSTVRAASLMGVSQPTVSRAIRRLEDTTRLRLFERSGPRLLPTPEAAELHREILLARAGLDRVRQAVARLREAGTGTLRVAASAAFGLHFLPPLVACFSERHPSILVTYEVAGSSVVRNLVAAGEFDVGFCADEVDTAGVVAEPFAAHPAICVMASQHPLAKLATIGPENLHGVPFIALAPEDTTRRLLQLVLDAVGVRPRIVIETSFSATVCQLALDGAGVGLANPLVYGSGGFKRLGLAARPFRPEIAFRSLMLTTAQRVKSGLASEFIALVLAHRQGDASHDPR